MSRPEYAPSGLIGLLTPQANTTVEPELSVLMPPGTSWLNARLLSTEQTIIARLTQYMTGLDSSADQFGNAPIEALALGCTGTGYVVGPAQEDALLRSVSQRLGIPVFSAATAVCDALSCLQARTVLLVSPYDGAVHEASEPYWHERGQARDSPFEVTECITLPTVEGFHPIYARQSDSLDIALAENSKAVAAADAVVILGTGMPTLATISRYRAETRASTPLLSCMLCLGWKSAIMLGASSNDLQTLLAWSRGDEWSSRLSQRLGASLAGSS